MTVNELSMGASTQFAWTDLSAQVGASGLDSSASLFLANSVRSVTLTTEAAQCMRVNVCEHTDNAGGGFVQTAWYGTLLRITLNHVHVDANAEVSVGETFGASFEFSTTNMSIAGGLIGAFSSLSELNAALGDYDISDIVTDLSNRDFLRATTQLRERASTLGIIAAELQHVSAEDCASLGG